MGGASIIPSLTSGSVAQATVFNLWGLIRMILVNLVADLNPSNIIFRVTVSTSFGRMLYSLFMVVELSAVGHLKDMQGFEIVVRKNASACQIVASSA